MQGPYITGTWLSERADSGSSAPAILQAEAVSLVAGLLCECYKPGASQQQDPCSQLWGRNKGQLPTLEAAGESPSCLVQLPGVCLPLGARVPRRALSPRVPGA